MIMLDITEKLLISFTFPFRAVSANNMYKKSRWRGIYKNKEAKEFELKIKNFIDQLPKKDISLPIEHPVELVYAFSYKNSHHQDLDNSIKCLTDALQNANIIKNDKQIFKLTAEKKINVSDDKIHIFIYEYIL